MKKEKKKVSANELQDAECKFISLVPKGANRIPFRYIKMDGSGKMKVDLSSIFKTEESFVASVVVNKTEGMDIEAIKDKISKAGLSVDDQEEQDGVIIFKQQEAGEAEHQYLLKTGDNTAVHVVLTKGFNPTDFETYSFKEMFAKGGVLPNIFMAHDLLKETIMNILFSPDMETSEMASKKVRKAINEFSDIVGGMVENIPVSAFKMAELEPTTKETAVNKGLQMKINKAALDKEEEEKQKAAKEAEGKKDESKKDETAADEGKKDEAKSEEGADKKDEAKKDDDSEADKKDESKKEDEDPLAKILKAIEGVTASVEDIKKSTESSINDIKNSVSDLKKEVEEVASVAKSADEAVKGAVNASPGADRTIEKKESVVKQADPLVDSGYVRRQRRG